VKTEWALGFLTDGTIPNPTPSNVVLWESVCARLIKILSRGLLEHRVPGKPASLRGRSSPGSLLGFVIVVASDGRSIRAY